MKQVKIISGTYGHNNGTRIEPKNRGSEPFLLSDAEATRLVLLGVAEIISEDVATPETGGEISNTGNNSSEIEDSKENENFPASEDNDIGEIPYSARPSYDSNSKVSVLREIGKSVGITFSVGTTKEDMCAKLDDFFNKFFADEPDLSAEEPLE